MEIQLTRTKTITIGGGAKDAKKKKKSARASDVVGVDLFSGDSRGCPAVRLTSRKGILQLAAAGFVPPPASSLPESWDDASKKCVWSLPLAFQAPSAAFAVTSPDMFYAQTTADAFRNDLANGGPPKEDAAPAGGRRLGIIRPGEPKSAASLSARLAGPAGTELATKSADAARPSTPPPAVVAGEPLSHGGTRFVMQPMSSSDGFVLEAGLPEYQLLWLSRLLPEGKRPTAASIQVRPSALTASILRQRAFTEDKGSALVLFVSAEDVHIAGYKGGDIVLWRRCRGVPGWNEIRATVRRELGLDDEMVESVLDDNLIDPRPVLEPLLAPILSELAVSRDYLSSKLGVEPKRALLMGLPAGAAYWSAIAEDTLRLKLELPDAFDGIEPAGKSHIDETAVLRGAGSHVFLGALGAALALLEEESAS